MSKVYVFLLPVGKPGSFGVFPTSSPGTPKTVLPPWLWPHLPLTFPEAHSHTSARAMSSKSSLLLRVSLKSNLLPTSDKPTSCPLLGDPCPASQIWFLPLLSFLAHTKRTAHLKLFAVGVDLVLCAIPSETFIPRWEGLSRTYTSRYFPQGPANSDWWVGMFEGLVADVVCCLEHAYQNIYLEEWAETLFWSLWKQKLDPRT